MGRFQRRSRVLFWRLRRALASGCEGRTRRLCRSTEKSWSNCLKSNQRSLVSPKNSCTNAINYFFFKIKLTLRQTLLFSVCREHIYFQYFCHFFLFLYRRSMDCFDSYKIKIQRNNPQKTKKYKSLI